MFSFRCEVECELGLITCVCASRAKYVCSDAPSPLEDHQEDVCRTYLAAPGDVGVDDIAFIGASLYESGAVCETELRVITPFPTFSASPSPLVCPAGWARYVDTDGSQGSDSCLIVIPGASDWGSANASCPTGSHLVTIRGSRPSAMFSVVYSLAVDSGMQHVGLGCSQVSTARERAAGWSWLDGTDDSNLNCPGPLAAGGNGCGLWSQIVGQPE